MERATRYGSCVPVTTIGIAPIFGPETGRRQFTCKYTSIRSPEPSARPSTRATAWCAPRFTTCVAAAISGTYSRKVMGAAHQLVEAEQEPPRGRSPRQSRHPDRVARPMRLQQILLNLLSNTCKFTKQGEVVVPRSAQGQDKTTPPPLSGGQMLSVPTDRRAIHRQNAADPGLEAADDGLLPPRLAR